MPLNSAGCCVWGWRHRLNIVTAVLFWWHVAEEHGQRSAELACLIGMAEERQVDMVINDLPIMPVPDQIRAGHPLGCV
jgi:hypothetical protein